MFQTFSNSVVAKIAKRLVTIILSLKQFAISVAYEHFVLKLRY